MQNSRVRAVLPGRDLSDILSFWYLPRACFWTVASRMSLSKIKNSPACAPTVSIQTSVKNLPATLEFTS